MKALVIILMFYSFNDFVNRDNSSQLIEIVSVFYNEEIISTEIRNELNIGVNEGKINSAAALFKSMEDLSFSSLPDSSQAYFSPDNYIALPPRGMFDPEHEVPEEYKKVVDYLHSKLIIGDKCRDSIYENMLKPSFGLDQLIERGILKHTFIGIFTEIEMCST
jgi:hypothetical protein